MSLHSPAENENADFVMPAWIAGIHQVRMDASEDIRVNLDSSTPCWNDAIKEALPELTETPPPVFSNKNTTNTKFRIESFMGFVLFFENWGWQSASPLLCPPHRGEESKKDFSLWSKQGFLPEFTLSLPKGSK